MPMSLYVCPLTHEGVIQVKGPDASKFLQGQLTCNLDYLSLEHSSLGARCTPKGRMLSSFRIVAVPEGYLLAMAAELVETQLADLKKYAVFSKVELSDVSQQWQRYGLLGSDAELQAQGLHLPNEAADSVCGSADSLMIRLSGQRFELWQAADNATSRALSIQATPIPLEQWLLEQIHAGVGQVFAATRELFIPQMINLQAVGGVSFRKGCYTGQEIVARMQYLGKLKRRMYRFSAQGVAPAAGTEIFSPVHTSSVGEVVLAAPTEGRCELLAVVQEDAVTDARLTLSNPQGQPLNRLDLPYSLDRDREIQR